LGTNNVGGTLILYDDDYLKQRVALAIDASSHGGFMQLEDNSSVVRLSANAYIEGFGSVLFCRNSDGVAKSWIAETSGVINGETIATQQWVVDNFVPK